MKKIILSALVLIAASGLNSCKKAGIDGNTTVVAYVKHHESVIKNHVSYPDTVWVEFNADQAPSDGVYDTYFVGQVGEDHVHMENLHTGKYFLYATGMDSAGPYRVTGGIAMKIKHSQKGKEIDQDIPVVE